MKKSLLVTLFALTMFIYMNIETSSSNKIDMNIQTLHTNFQNALQTLKTTYQTLETSLKSLQNNMISNPNTIKVQDSNGNIIGTFQTTKSIQGFTVGLFYPAPIQVVQGSGNAGTTPIWCMLPGASSLSLGYIKNQNYSSSSAGIAGGAISTIPLYQYNPLYTEPKPI